MIATVVIRSSLESELRSRWWNQTGQLGIVAALIVAAPSCSNPDALSDKAAADDKNKISSPSASVPLRLTASEMLAQRLINASVSARTKDRDAMTLALKGLQQSLFDAGSAKLLEVRAGRNGSSCGKVNAKNRYGAYVGFSDFVVLKDSTPFISTTNDKLTTTTTGAFADAYATNCANNDERLVYDLVNAPQASYDGDENANLKPDEPASTVPEQEPDTVLDAPQEPEPKSGQNTRADTTT